MKNTDRIGRVAVALVALLAVLLPGAPAWAHNALVGAQPAKDATVSKSPTTVKLDFLQKLNPEFTTIVVSDAARQPVPVSAPTVAGKSGSVKLSAPLANGEYTVAYQVVSTDGHTVKGSYTFTVADPDAVPASEPAAPASSAPAAEPESAPASAPAAVPAAAAADDGGSSGPLLIGAVAVVAALAGAAVFFVARSRRSA